MYLGMTQNELIQHLYDEINRQDTWYMWSVGTLITIIALVVGFYSYQQWRFSDKGIKKMQEEFRKKFHDEFFKEFHDEFHDEFFDEFKKEYEIDRLKSAIVKADKRNEESTKLQGELRKEINKSLEMSLLSLSSQFESIDKTGPTYILSNKLINLLIFLRGKDLNDFSAGSIRDALIVLNNGMSDLLKNNVAWNKKTSLALRKINKYFHKAYDGFEKPIEELSEAIKVWDKNLSEYEKRKTTTSETN